MKTKYKFIFSDEQIIIIIMCYVAFSSKETVPSISSVRRDEEDELYILPALPPVEDKDRSR